MGMIMILAALSEETTASLREHPERSSELLFDPEMDAEMAKIGHTIERELSEPAAATLDLEKSWHLIHFGLTRQVDGGEWPRSFLMSGEMIGPDLGYGPGRILSSEQVQVVAKALADIDFAAEFEQITPNQLFSAGVYPVHSPDESYEAWRDYAVANFQETVQFMTAAGKAGQSVFIAIS